MATCALQGCSRPAHFDATSGVRHHYCGRTHAHAALAARNQVLAPPHGACHVCKLPGCEETVYFEQDTGRVHDFCGRAHANMALELGLARPSQRGRLAPGSSRDAMCALPGCVAPRFVDPDTGREHDYCGRTHATLAHSRGLVPPPEGMPRAWFSQVWRGRPGQEPYTLSLLTNQFHKYQGIKNQFASSWTHPIPSGGRAPTVLRIYQVRNSSAVFETYCAYKAELEAVRGDANEKRLFHGTSLDAACHFGVSPSQSPCSSEHCAVCNICEASFDLSRSGRGGGAAWGGLLRYGRGLYFSRSSSKSNDYAADSDRAGVRAMFLCRVLVGQPLRTPAAQLLEDEFAREIMTGMHDSVEALTIPQGGALNHPETVVYRADAALPSYLVVYQTY